MIKIYIYVIVYLFYFNASGSYGFKVDSENTKEESGSLVQVEKMPKVRSQDSIGICYSATASVLIDAATCKYDRSITSCQDMPADKKVSMLDYTRFQTGNDNSRASSRGEFEGLNFDGGKLQSTLGVGIRYGGATSFMKESCAPFDQVVSKVSDPVKAQEIDLKMWERFKSFYENQNKSDCVECGLEYATAKSAELEKEYNLKVSPDVMLRAFAQDTYNKFLDVMLIPDECFSLTQTVNVPPNLQMDYLPKPNIPGNYDSLISKIKDRLSSQVPLGIDFCTMEPRPAGAENCEGNWHSVAIKGYRRICDEQNRCRDSIQVQNSWGDQWQKDNNQGWVDAKELLDRTFYRQASLVWVENQPVRTVINEATN